jgi:hypothetical protein
VALMALAMTLPACAGVYGPKGNDTGGIIPWSPDAERVALVIANENCNSFRKYAVITSMRRRYGEYIVYECRFFRHDPAVVVLTSKG